MATVQMKVKETKSKSHQIFPSKKFSLNDQFLPRIKKTKLITRNPFLIKKVKPMAFVHERKTKELNGYLMMKVSKAQHPYEVEYVDLSGLNIANVNHEHLVHFKNLREINLNMNQLNIEDLKSLENLEKISLQGNLIEEIDIEQTTQLFSRLIYLDISYNRILASQLLSLSGLQNLKELNISANDIQSLPYGMNSLSSLENLNLSNNQINSKEKASENWEILASIVGLKVLNLSRNQLRGIHTEKLKAGDFIRLEMLDMSYNLVDNQYNLICSRNFQNLRQLDISGNPFAKLNQHKGLEMEVIARTGATIINEAIEKPYLKKKQTAGQSVAFGNIVKLQEQYVQKGGKTYFFGVDLPNFKAENEQEQEQEEEEEEQIDDNEDKFFLTEDVNKKQRKGQKQVEQLDTEEMKQKEQLDNEKKMVRQEVKQFEGEIGQNYNEFKRITAEVMGGQKDYDDPIELLSCYKILQQILRKPNIIELNDSKQKNYEKGTISMSRRGLDESKSMVNYSKSQMKGGNDLQMVQQILDQLNQKIKQDVG